MRAWIERWTTFFWEGNRDRVLPMWMAVGFAVVVLAAFVWLLS